MKKAWIIILGLTVINMSCGIIGNSKRQQAGDILGYSVDGTAFNMRFLPGGISFPTGGDMFAETVPRNYYIGETEINWDLWYTVYTWATDPAIDHDGDGGTGDDVYRFSNTGQMGSNPDGRGMDPFHPVTNVSWRDALLWCNALTEYINMQNIADMECVYYSDENYFNPLRESTNSLSITLNTPGSQDHPYIRAAKPGNTDPLNCTANGFRLPTVPEWIMAARWIGNDNGGLGTAISSGNYAGFGELTEGYFWTPGDYASGGWAAFDADTDINNNGIADGIDSNNDVAVYGFFGEFTVQEPTGVTGTARIRSKKPNRLGLYDMSGNVWEWCFDSSTYFITYRAIEGGCWRSIDSTLSVGFRDGWEPYQASNGLGFRLARDAD